MEKSQSGLNKYQQQAVEHIDGPLLIVAGAGTGKTTVISKKVAYLIEKNIAKPEEILALTFTEKAAQEMHDRVDALLDIGYVDLQISTFHSFCQKILERYGLDIGIPNQFKLLTETDAWLLIRQNLDKFDLDYYRPIGNPSRHIHELIKHFSKCKDELIEPADYLKYAKEMKLNQDGVIPAKAGIHDDSETEIKRLSEISNAYHVYNQLLLDNNALDFGDLLFYTVKLLEKRPQILGSLQDRFKYILVDEFQDVNWAQYFLVQKLAEANGQLTVVGDDDQSIYAFRGASVSNIMRFKDDFPKAKEIVLTDNYRSHQEILDTAYKLIQNNNPDRLEVKLNLDKKLKNNLDGKGFVIHSHLNTLQDEIDFVAEEIAKIKREKEDITWDDFAILVRANSHASEMVMALERRGIPYEFIASAGLFRQPIVLDCLNFFRAISDYHESSAIYRLLHLPCRRFKENDIQKLLHSTKKKSTSCYEALKRSAEFGVTPEGGKFSTELIDIIHEGMKQARTEKPTVVLYNFLNKSGYLNFLTREEEQGNNEVIRQIYQLKQFFEYVSKFEVANPGFHVRNFLEHFEYVLESGEKGLLYQPTDTPDSVNILTVHSAKGLEYKYVFVINLVEERFPTRSRGEAIEIPTALIKEQLPEGDAHIQEERRLLYVAITRAKERLYLTSAGDYGGARTKKPSRFLGELGFAVAGAERKKEKILENLQQPVHEEKKGDFVYDLPSAFSFSQIKSYETCPYQYKLSHILKIPVKGSASFSFGQTMHGALQEFYQKIQEMNQIQQVSLFGFAEPTDVLAPTVKVPSLDELLDMYKKHWIDDWYKNKKQREEYFAKGEEVMCVLYKSQENNWTIPACLESWFKIKVGDYLVHGRIDRVDKLADGTLEIIDYKTGKAKEKVTGEDKDQLIIYQIAAEQLPEYRNIGIPSKLTYIYLNDNIRVSFLGEEKEKDKLKEKLKNVISKIHSRDFTPTPGQFVCVHCDFKDICDHRE